MILPITRGTNYVYNFTKEIIFMLCTITLNIQQV